MDGVVGIAEHEIGGILEVAADPSLALGVFCGDLPGREREELSGERGIGGRLEDDGHLHLPGLERRSDHRDPSGQLAAIEQEFAVEVGPRGVHEDREAVAPRHDHRLPRLREAVDPRDREGEPRRGGREFHAVGEVGLAAAEVVFDAHEILAVFGHVEPEDRVGPLGVVVARHGAAVGLEHVDHGIEAGPQPAGVALHLEGLPLLRRKPEVIDVAGLLDHAVERERGIGRRRRGGFVVGLLLEGIAARRDPEGQGGGAGAAVVGRKQPVRAADRHGGHVELPHDRSRCIAEKGDGHLLARLAPGGVDGRGTREPADVEAVAGTAVAAIGGFADLHQVAAILGGEHREDAVLERGRRVIGDGELKPLGVDDRDVRIEPVAAKPQSLDLHREPLAFREVDREAIDIFGGDDAVDGVVERHRLGLVGGAVGLDLVEDWQPADPERPVVADARRRADLHDLLARRARLGHVDHGLERSLIGARGQRRHGEAVVAVEKDFLRVAQPFTAELELAVAAALHPAGKDQREARR